MGAKIEAGRERFSAQRWSVWRGRLRCVLVWPFLYLMDLGLAWSGRNWKAEREYSNNALREVWNRKNVNS